MCRAHECPRKTVVEQLRTRCSELDAVADCVTTFAATMANRHGHLLPGGSTRPKPPASSRSAAWLAARARTSTPSKEVDQNP